METKTIQKEWSFNFDFNVTTGKDYGRFFNGLKEKKFLGNKIGESSYFPPKPFCSRTLKFEAELLECDGTGIVEAFTIYHDEINMVNFPQNDSIPKVPFVLGVIKIGNSDQCLLHFLSGFDMSDIKKLPEQIKVGMKVKPVWAEVRTGGILDIKYFQPA
jgi:uncharacterized protein